MTKAEELANKHWCEWAGSPRRDQLVALMQEYGQLVKEAAAQVLEAQATCGCQGKHGYCMTDDPPKAHAMLLREMPLP
jgi:hypothetical protein